MGRKPGHSKKILIDDIDKNNVVVQEVKIKPQESARTHFHKIQTEVFYFLTHNGYWVMNGEKREFGIGDILIIGPMDEHCVVNRTNKDYLYLAFKYNYDSKDIYWK
ncbi:MAG: cupin domain-containing protein [Candidatus Levybacteria bacterium]|nr:cupin domain-containing protein [Candidatus Levybacteria bacterium]